MAKRRKSYVSAPAPQTEQGRRRYLIMQQVQAGELTVSEGAKELGISRVRFQTLLHRGLGAMVEALEPKSAGRPRTNAETRRLRRENQALRKESERMRRRLGKMEQVLALAADVMSRRIAESRGVRRRSESRGGKSSSGGGGAREAKSGEEEPEGRRWADLEAAEAMRRLGLPQAMIAALIGASGRTLRRWRHRFSLDQSPWRPHVPRRTGLTAATARAAEGLVRRLRGLVGADTIRHTVSGISRRQATALKTQTVTAMERERKQASRRVVVNRPGLIRGFDAMYVETTQGWRFPLIAADAAVPFRTSVTVAFEASAEEIGRALARDLETNGAPLVVRLDRARAHDSPLVTELLEAHGVLALHGPPHCARYYGQLERQNREHRAWLKLSAPLTPSALGAECEDMIHALSFEWRRPTLSWRTASEVWEERTEIDEDRESLREEVNERAAYLKEFGIESTMAMRLAIEKALTDKGYLRFESWTDC